MLAYFISPCMPFRHTKNVQYLVKKSKCDPKQIREAAVELGYQPDPTFCLKVSQLREIFSVRWSVFLLGPAGCGKTAIWKTLARAQQLAGEKTVTRPINPKV